MHILSSLCLSTSLCLSPGFAARQRGQVCLLHRSRVVLVGSLCARGHRQRRGCERRGRNHLEHDVCPFCLGAPVEKGRGEHPLPTAPTPINSSCNIASAKREEECGRCGLLWRRQGRVRQGRCTINRYSSCCCNCCSVVGAGVVRDNIGGKPTTYRAVEVSAPHRSDAPIVAGFLLV